MAAHRYWRIYIIDTYNGSGGEYAAIAKLEMRTIIGGSNVCSGGTPFASSTYGGPGSNYDAQYAFDSDPHTRWTGDTGSYQNSYLGYDFGAGNPKDIAEILVQATYEGGVSGDAPKNYRMEYSDNGTTYSTSWTGTFASWPAQDPGYIQTGSPPALTVTGTARANATVEVQFDNVTVQTVTANGSGAFTTSVRGTRGSHTIRARQTSSGNTSGYSSDVHVTGLDAIGTIVYFHFDESGAPWSSSEGVAASFTVSGSAPTVVSGRIGNGLSFPGTVGCNINATESGHLLGDVLASDNFTIECSLKQGAGGNYGWSHPLILAMNAGSCYFNFYWDGPAGNSNLRINYNDSANAGIDTGMGGYYGPDGNWNKFVITRQWKDIGGGSWRLHHELFYNGTFKGVYDGTNHAHTNAGASASLHIGDWGATDNAFHGMIDELRITNTVLTSGQFL